MENTKFCQSCSMPLDSSSMYGTEKDGSANPDYCKYCYQNGAFVTPGLTIEEMKGIVKSEMDKRNIASEITAKAIGMLPYLKRWKNH